MPRSKPRQFFRTAPTMAHPKGRLAVHLPRTSRVYVVTHDGQWDLLNDRDRPLPEWETVTAKAARDWLQRDGIVGAYTSAPTQRRG